MKILNTEKQNQVASSNIRDMRLCKVSKENKGLQSLKHSVTGNQTGGHRALKGKASYSWEQKQDVRLSNTNSYTRFEFLNVNIDLNA